jgi:regulatory protein YycI of two-component signal transduction system YycFG
VPQFQKVTANNEVIGYSGTLMPREDPTTGRAVKMAVVNAATAVYA